MQVGRAMSAAGEGGAAACSRRAGGMQVRTPCPPPAKGVLKTSQRQQQVHKPGTKDDPGPAQIANVKSTKIGFSGRVLGSNKCRQAGSKTRFWTRQK